MSWFRGVARIGLVALLLNAGLILVPGNRIGTAFAIDIAIADPSRSEAPPTAGDPDGPTGDITADLRLDRRPGHCHQAPGDADHFLVTDQHRDAVVAPLLVRPLGAEQE